MNAKINGTFFEFRHHNTAEGKYWNPALEGFQADDWRRKIREISQTGMEYIVLMATALYDRCYFNSSVFPFADMPCKDPIEEVLDEADKCGLKVFLGNGFYGDWTKAGQNIRSREVIDRSFRAMEELTALYAHHTSFYGWYFPDETCIILNFSKDFVKYVNLCSARCHELTPEKKTLIAPYGTNLALANSRFIHTLEELDVDFIAYQDEVGVKKTKVDRTKRIFEKLRTAHDKAGRSELWADIELFDFEGMVYKSALIPASFERVKKQIENVAPYADKILCYQYPGIMNPSVSQSFAGHPDSVRLYDDYISYIRNGD
ncbi:MAG: DUF4434 domain-containing protein [Ruminococcaceae bacterium]|nr:DUF4434 domain-containing protein [Oscillospiraceae bacterium]